MTPAEAARDVVVEWKARVFPGADLEVPDQWLIAAIARAIEGALESIVADAVRMHRPDCVGPSSCEGCLWIGWLRARTAPVAGLPTPWPCGCRVWPGGREDHCALHRAAP